MADSESGKIKTERSYEVKPLLIADTVANSNTTGKITACYAISPSTMTYTHILRNLSTTLWSQCYSRYFKQ